VDWKLFIKEAHCIFQSQTMIFLTIQRYLEIIFIYLDVYNYWKRVVSYNFVLLNLIIKSFWLLVQWRSLKWSHTVFLIVESWFLWSYKFIWKLFSYMWIYMTYWNRGVSYHSLALLECNFFIIKSHCIFRLIPWFSYHIKILGNYFHVFGCIWIT